MSCTPILFRTSEVAMVFYRKLVVQHIVVTSWYRYKLTLFVLRGVQIASSLTGSTDVTVRFGRNISCLAQ